MNQENVAVQQAETLKPIATKPTKKNNKKLICIISLIVGVIIIGVCVLFFILTRPDKILNKVLDTSYSFMSSALKESDKFNLDENSMLMTGDLVFETDTKGLQDLKAEEFNYTLGIDNKNSKMEFGLGLNENNKELLNIMIYFLNNKAYVDTFGLFDKLILVEDVNVTGEEIDYTMDDVDYVLKEMTNILKESLVKESITKSDTTIMIGEKEEKVTRISYSLDKENLIVLINNVKSHMLENEKLLNTLSKISGVTLDDIKDEINNIDTSNVEDLGAFNIYTKGLLNNVIKIEYRYTTETMELIFNESSTDLNYIGETGESILFNIKSFGADNTDIDYTYTDGTTEVSGNITSSQEKINDNNYKGNIEFTFKMNDENIKGTSNYEIKLGEKIADVNTSKAVTMDKITDTELQSFQTKLFTKLSKSNLFNIYATLTTQSNYY